MLIEFLKLALGLAIMGLHRPFGEFILEREHAFAALFRRAGLPYPAPLPLRYLQNIYFALGATVSLIQLVRIWSLLR